MISKRVKNADEFCGDKKMSRFTIHTAHITLNMFKISL